MSKEEVTPCCTDCFAMGLSAMPMAGKPLASTMFHCEIMAMTLSIKLER